MDPSILLKILARINIIFHFITNVKPFTFMVPFNGD